MKQSTNDLSGSYILIPVDLGLILMEVGLNLTELILSLMELGFSLMELALTLIGISDDSCVSGSLIVIIFENILTELV